MTPFSYSLQKFLITESHKVLVGGLSENWKCFQTGEK